MCAKIMKRKKSSSSSSSSAEEKEEEEKKEEVPPTQRQRCPFPVPRGTAVRRISLNDYLILVHQLMIDQSAQDWHKRNVKMLVIRGECGPQHVITFKLPGSSCTVHDILEQLGVQFDETTTIDCLENPGGNIHVVVSVGFIMKAPAGEMASQAEEMYNEMVEMKKLAPSDPKRLKLEETTGKLAFSNGTQKNWQADSTPQWWKREEPSATVEETACPRESNLFQRLFWRTPSPGRIDGATKQLEPQGTSATASSPAKPSVVEPTKSLPDACPFSRLTQTLEEQAEKRRLRRNRRYLLSQDFDDAPVVLLSSEDEEPTTDEGLSETGDGSQGLEGNAPSVDKKPRQLSADEDLTLLRYPPTGTGGLCISMKDYMCLSRSTYLNDIIIDFYLLWLKNTVIPEAQRDRTHIFSTFFHKRLTTLSRPMNMKQTAAQKRHERVQKWTRSVDIFDKDFIIIPFNDQAHWILAIICFPSLPGPIPYDDGQLSGDDDPIKQPVILIFDSFPGVSRNRVMVILRDYLTCEYRAKKPNAEPRVFNKINMPGHRVKVPQQENLTDCGLYLLQYVEQFFTKPIRDYRLPINELSNWFDLLTVTKKREDIANLIQRLMDENTQHQQRKILPVIEFPTRNGQMVED
ncbi:ubiquitin-like-specific protease 1C [Drosophila ficusphila]|uniref:ubiquitin-like-specific protease 1C n=1 Tax=Drosophila ficusphila TaxID=30025 RepID=UPI0007E758B1|nr:ubiquitin-like-specific protease 1C [Drosophila ficusphila]XP_017052212.1 ubiquitin-like-specific protease 1C [Drosophila ficusphila]